MNPSVGLRIYKIDWCSVVYRLVKYGINSADVSSQVRKDSWLGACKIQITK